MLRSLLSLASMSGTHLSCACSCPFDFVKIYDGYTKEAPVIGTFCGNYNSSTVLYSTAEALHVEFVTGQGRVLFGKPVMDQEADFKFERKGFNITYEFSDQFVDLGNHLLSIVFCLRCWLMLMTMKVKIKLLKGKRAVADMESTVRTHL